MLYLEKLAGEDERANNKKSHVARGKKELRAAPGGCVPWLPRYDLVKAGITLHGLHSYHCMHCTLNVLRAFRCPPPFCARKFDE